MVRAGEGGFLFDEFKSKNVVAIGWNKLGDLVKAKNNDEIKDKLIKTYEYTNGKLANVTCQLSRFRFDFKIADHVITITQSLGNTL
jgi:restriction system protein